MQPGETSSTKSVWGACCSPYLSGGCICLQFSSLFCVGVTTYCTSIKRTGNFVPSLAHGSWKCWSCTVNVVCILYESFDSQNHLIEYLYQCIIIYLYRKSSLHGVPYLLWVSQYSIDDFLHNPKYRASRCNKTVRNWQMTLVLWIHKGRHMPSIFSAGDGEISPVSIQDCFCTLQTLGSLGKDT